MNDTTEAIFNFAKSVQDMGAEVGHLTIRDDQDEPKVSVIAVIGPDAVTEYEAFEVWRRQEHVTHEQVLEHLAVND